MKARTSGHSGRTMTRKLSLGFLRDKWRLRLSIKEGVDNLPCGIAFARPSGIVILCNHTMHKLSQDLLGEQLLNAELFWQKTVSAGTPAGVDAYALHLPGGGIWTISRRQTWLENKPVLAYEAQDVTEIYALNDQLQEDNCHLDDLSERLRRYNREALELGRQRELLERRILVHDELGHLLTRTRYCLAGGDADLQDLWEKWQLNAGLMLQDAQSQDVPMPEQIRAAARAVGVEVIFSGDVPQSGVAGEILMHAAGEALTNVLRHARGSRLEIACMQNNGWFVFKMRNDGQPPAEIIQEGGGLSALRRKTEEAGGMMKIISAPAFCLEIHVPGRGNENVSHFDCGR